MTYWTSGTSYVLLEDCYLVSLKGFIGHSIVKAPNILDIRSIVHKDFLIGIQRYSSIKIININHLFVLFTKQCIGHQENCTFLFGKLILSFGEVTFQSTLHDWFVACKVYCKLFVQTFTMTGWVLLTIPNKFSHQLSFWLILFLFWHNNTDIPMSYHTNLVIWSLCFIW